MAQISIYIPADLQSRMADHGDINWSAYAQEAFERAIREDKQVTQAMPELTKRMRATKQKYREEQKEAGRAAGIRFATINGGYEDLLILRQFLESDRREDFAQELFTLYQNIYGDYREFSDQLFDNRDVEPSDEYVAAFAEAAVEVLEKAEEEAEAED